MKMIKKTKQYTTRIPYRQLYKTLHFSHMYILYRIRHDYYINKMTKKRSTKIRNVSFKKVYFCFCVCV